MVKTVDQQLKNKCLKEIRVPGDGNCQFHSISHSLKSFGISVSYTELRHLAIQYIRKHKNYYKDFIWDESFSQYIRNLKNGEYGDNITLDALANHFDLCINILREKRVPNIINKDGHNTITLVYWGDDGDDAHYNSTQHINTCKKTKQSKHRSLQKLSTKSHNKSKKSSSYKMVIPKKGSKPKSSALGQYIEWVDGGIIKNFMILFGYPFTINWDENGEIYFETASTQILKLCKNALTNRTKIHLGYFIEKCNFNTVYIGAIIKDIVKNDSVRGVKINKQPVQKLVDYKIIIKAQKWIFGEFVGSTARNSKITDSNFNVQKKLYYKGDDFQSMKYVASPCDNDDKRHIFTYKCKNLISLVK